MNISTLNHMKEITFADNMMTIKVNEQVINVRLEDVSQKLANANDAQRNDFKISPTDYGIHWNQLDEDLSLKGLMNK